VFAARADFSRSHNLIMPIAAVVKKKLMAAARA
jgi:hypothetical protein